MLHFSAILSEDALVSLAIGYLPAPNSKHENSENHKDTEDTLICIFQVFIFGMVCCEGKATQAAQPTSAQQTKTNYSQIGERSAIISQSAATASLAKNDLKRKMGNNVIVPNGAQ